MIERLVMFDWLAGSSSQCLEEELLHLLWNLICFTFWCCLISCSVEVSSAPDGAFKWPSKTRDSLQRRLVHLIYPPKHKRVIWSCDNFPSWRGPDGMLHTFMHIRVFFFTLITLFKAWKKKCFLTLIKTVKFQSVWTFCVLCPATQTPMAEVPFMRLGIRLRVLWDSLTSEHKYKDSCFLYIYMKILKNSHK